jgi:hypothetical protein
LNVAVFSVFFKLLIFFTIFLVSLEKLQIIMRNKALLCILLLSLTIVGFSQSVDSAFLKSMSSEVMNNAKAYDNLRFICKKIGPRLSGSPQAQKAVEATMKMLKDAGADTVYLQPLFVPHWVRGAKETGFIQMANGSKKQLNLCALGNAVGTGKKGITAAVVEVRNFNELDQLGEAGVKGKIVFFNFPMEPAFIETFNAYGASGAYRTRGPSKAGKLGAIGVMVRSLASNPDDFPHTGVTVYNDSFPKIPAVAISTNDAIWLSQQLKLKMQVKAYLQTNCEMLPDAPSFNVVGELRGKEFPQEIISVGGHLDSWDLAEGAQDDGAGIVQSIEVIRAIKATGIQPKRTIRAVMFMNEENGGRGGEKYLELAKLNKELHLFGLESDAGGFTPRSFGFDAKESQLEKIMQWKILFAPYSVYDLTKGGGGADIGPLKTIGAAVAGLRPDSQRYFDIHHAATDVFEGVSRRELHLGAFNMAALVYLVDKYGL